MTRQSTADNLADMVRNLGGTTKGRETTAQLLDKLEGIAPQGDAPSQEAMAAAIESYLEEHTGGLTDDDMNDIFGGD